MVTITYFVHCTTTDNEQKLATGWLPGELSAAGYEQTRKLREQTADLRFDTIFCSDLKRAIDTARLTFGDRFPIMQDDRLRECNYGDLEGGPKAKKDEMMTDCIAAPFPNGESYRDVEARLESFCQFLKENYDGKHVAIVAHEAPQLALEVLVKNKSGEQAIGRKLAHSWAPGSPGWDLQDYSLSSGTDRVGPPE